MLTIRLIYKKGTDSILAVTSTLDSFSQFLAWIILTIRVTEKLWNAQSILAWHYVMTTSLWRHWNMWFLQENRVREKRDQQYFGHNFDKIKYIVAVFYRAMHMHKRGICRHPVSVRLSVCPSRSWVAPKRIKISSKFFHHRVTKPF